jgi:hypothetical protein
MSCEGVDVASVSLFGVGSVSISVASRTGEGFNLASDHLVGVGSVSHCVGENDR